MVVWLGNMENTERFLQHRHSGFGYRTRPEQLSGTNRLGKTLDSLEQHSGR